MINEREELQLLRNNCKIEFNSRYSKIYEDKPYVLSNIEVGDFSFCWGRFLIYPNPNSSKVIIKKFCSIADSVTFILNGNHHTDYATQYSRFYKLRFVNKFHDIVIKKGNIIVGNDVWIGYGATILEGVELGDGSVVAASSVITKNVPPYAIVAGNPAKVIRYRFSDKNIDNLLEMQWWDWTDNMLVKCMPHLLSSNIDMLYELYKLSK